MITPSHSARKWSGSRAKASVAIVSKSASDGALSATQVLDGTSFIGHAYHANSHSQRGSLTNILHRHGAGYRVTHALDSIGCDDDGPRGDRAVGSARRRQAQAHAALCASDRSAAEPGASGAAAESGQRAAAAGRLD